MIRESRSPDLPSRPGADAHYQYYRGSGSHLSADRQVNKILLHLGLWPTNQRPPPKSLELQIDYSDSQLPFYEEAFDQDLRGSADQATP